MTNFQPYLNDITAKDEKKALIAAKYLLDNGDVEFFKALVNKTEFMFDFIKQNLAKRLEKSSDENNYKNIIKFFDIYSQDFDETFAIILAKFASENLTDEIFDLLENGTPEQKTYSAKYFSFIPDTIALETLNEYCFCDDEALAFNASQALGKMEDEKSYQKALEMLEDKDDFEKLKAVKFFVAYAKNAPLEAVFKSMKASAMPENIAGEIPYLVNLVSILDSDHKKNVLITIDNIIGGLGEILPLSQIFQFELYDILSRLIDTNKTDNHYKSKIAQILLKALAKFQMLCQSDEYTFDEDKNTKQELTEILALLERQNKAFWDEQKTAILDELSHCKHRIIGALEVIKEIKLVSAAEKVKTLLTYENEIVVCEAVSTLQILNSLDGIKKENILNKLSDENIKAIINSIMP
ncbi:MAG: hypothetical protein PHV37_09240 [Candidatus Gastranaerophilales bacterium]|nr:hypothetical protein [Candidatus Gastranaerophilales bacterium]